MVHPQRALSQARTLFTEQGAVPKGMVAESILRSWRRCADLGIDMRSARRSEPLTGYELRQLRQRHEALRRVAEPAMAQLRRAGDLVILSDAAGLVLDCEGDAVFAERASRVALLPGVSWGEAAAGTNAIGTALAEGRALAVHGAEHFFEPNRILTCTAVPILNSQGQVAGVLDLSSQARELRPEMLAQVQAAVELIERGLFELNHARHERVRVAGGEGEAWLAFDGDRLAGANRHAMALLGLDGSAIGSVQHAELRLPQRGRARARPVQPAPRSGAQFLPQTEVDLERAVRLSDAGVAILLQGETGAGKEVFARELHARGQRAHGPFVAINCAALPESLIESELFGYEEGAFTGARRQGSKGLLRQAHGGTLFLDEIGDMPLALQARLLRVLQTREVSPLGGAKPVDVDFALICATHRPLAQHQGDAPVRADLYFRIAEYTVSLPPLRDRPDLAGLIRAMWGQGAETLPAAIEAELAAYAWPGNYRQLSAVLRTLKVLAGPGGVVERDMLPADIRCAPAPDLQTATDAVIEAALAAHGGNVSRAAKALGVHRSTLYRRRPRF